MNTSKPQLWGIIKLKSENIRIRIEMKEKVAKLKKVKWLTIYKELATYKIKYKVIIYEIFIDEINLNKELKVAIMQLEKENEEKEIKILKIISLNKKTAMQSAATH